VLGRSAPSAAKKFYENRCRQLTIYFLADIFASQEVAKSAATPRENSAAQAVGASHE
jgi:hypothetical protein